MTDTVNDIKYLLHHPVFIKLQAYGLIDDFALRNFIIKKEYRLLRNNYSYGDSISILSKKYFLTEFGISNILFRKRNKKFVQFSVVDF